MSASDQSSPARGRANRWQKRISRCGRPLRSSKPPSKASARARKTSGSACSRSCIQPVKRCTRAFTVSGGSSDRSRRNPCALPTKRLCATISAIAASASSSCVSATCASTRGGSSAIASPIMGALRHSRASIARAWASRVAAGSASTTSCATSEASTASGSGARASTRCRAIESAKPPARLRSSSRKVAALSGASRWRTSTGIAPASRACSSAWRSNAPTSRGTGRAGAMSVLIGLT
ncbi:hypothetical protein IP68_18110 [Blastomonas sp. AAP25]|nr:hypothetical protein IP68_18110 [Blastomonas sp. AAP25]